VVYERKRDRPDHHSGRGNAFSPQASEVGDFTIVTGSDHDLYYAGGGNGNGYIVKLTTAGVQTQYLVPANPGSSGFFTPTPLEDAFGFGWRDLVHGDECRKPRLYRTPHDGRCVLRLSDTVEQHDDEYRSRSIR
jgi:hypothetical protein